MSRSLRQYTCRTLAPATCPMCGLRSEPACLSSTTHPPCLATPLLLPSQHRWQPSIVQTAAYVHLQITVHCMLRLRGLRVPDRETVLQLDLLLLLLLQPRSPANQCLSCRHYCFHTSEKKTNAAKNAFAVVCGQTAVVLVRAA
jgi:hypothetical protein